MKNLKTYKLFESKSYTDIEKDILELKDILLELNDIGIYTNVDFTPITLASIQKSMKSNNIFAIADLSESELQDLKSQFYIMISSSDTAYGLYGYMYKYKELVDECIERCLDYLTLNDYNIDPFKKENGYPSFYQIIFSK